MPYEKGRKIRNGETCAHEGELVPMKAKIMWNFGSNRYGVPYEKRLIIMNGGTCAHEGELVPMKAKIVGFWLKPVGGTLRKRLENHEWRNLCP